MAPPLRHPRNPDPRTHNLPPRRALLRPHDPNALHGQNRPNRHFIQQQPRLQQHGLHVSERGVYPDVEGVPPHLTCYVTSYTHANLAIRCRPPAP